MRRIAFATALFASTAVAQAADVLARQGDWLAAFIPSPRKICALGSESPRAAFWIKAEPGEVGYIQIRNTGWTEAGPVSIAFSGGERFRSPGFVDGQAVVVSFKGQWPEFLKAVEAFGSAREAAVTIPGHDPMRLKLGVRDAASAFLTCVKERLTPET